jgi:predicted N-acyltransferase
MSDASWHDEEGEMAFDRKWAEAFVRGVRALLAVPPFMPAADQRLNIDQVVSGRGL